MTIDEALFEGGEYDADALPEGLLLLQEAAEQAGVKRRTVAAWIERGKLQPVARIPGKGGPHGGRIVVRLVDVLTCRDNPRKPGPAARSSVPSY